jgi:hypothetical protein
MARRLRNRKDSPRNCEGESDRHGELIVGKHGVYMVRGDRKLKSIRLIPWEQLLASPFPSGKHAVAPNPE